MKFAILPESNEGDSQLYSVNIWSDKADDYVLMCMCVNFTVANVIVRAFAAAKEDSNEDTLEDINDALSEIECAVAN